jgi:hypothetical protein
MLILTLAPHMAENLWTDNPHERNGGLAILGMFITLAGIAITMFKPDRINRKMVFNKPFSGIMWPSWAHLARRLA